MTTLDLTDFAPPGLIVSVFLLCVYTKWSPMTHFDIVILFLLLIAWTMSQRFLILPVIQKDYSMTVSAIKSMFNLGDASSQESSSVDTSSLKRIVVGYLDMVKMNNDTLSRAESSLNDLNALKLRQSPINWWTYSAAAVVLIAAILTIMDIRHGQIKITAGHGASLAAALAVGTALVMFDRFVRCQKSCVSHSDILYTTLKAISAGLNASLFQRIKSGEIVGNDEKTVAFDTTLSQAQEIAQTLSFSSHKNISESSARLGQILGTIQSEIQSQKPAGSVTESMKTIGTTMKEFVNSIKHQDIVAEIKTVVQDLGKKVSALTGQHSQLLKSSASIQSTPIDSHYSSDPKFLETVVTPVPWGHLVFAGILVLVLSICCIYITSKYIQITDYALFVTLCLAIAFLMAYQLKIVQLPHRQSIKTLLDLDVDFAIQDSID